jgi:hypothetical protein
VKFMDLWLNRFTPDGRRAYYTRNLTEYLQISQNTGHGYGAKAIVSKEIDALKETRIGRI